MKYPSKGTQYSRNVTNTMYTYSSSWIWWTTIRTKIWLSFRSPLSCALNIHTVKNLLKCFFTNSWASSSTNIPGHVNSTPITYCDLNKMKSTSTCATRLTCILECEVRQIWSFFSLGSKDRPKVVWRQLYTLTRCSQAICWPFTCVETETKTTVSPNMNTYPESPRVLVGNQQFCDALWDVTYEVHITIILKGFVVQILLHQCHCILLWWIFTKPSILQTAWRTAYEISTELQNEHMETSGSKTYP